jgi:hypothetical protein
MIASVYIQTSANKHKFSKIQLLKSAKKTQRLQKPNYLSV